MLMNIFVLQVWQAPLPFIYLCEQGIKFIWKATVGGNETNKSWVLETME